MPSRTLSCALPRTISHAIPRAISRKISRTISRPISFASLRSLNWRLALAGGHARGVRRPRQPSLVAPSPRLAAPGARWRAGAAIACPRCVLTTLPFPSVVAFRTSRTFRTSAICTFAHLGVARTHPMFGTHRRIFHVRLTTVRHYCSCFVTPIFCAICFGYLSVRVCK